MKSDRHLFIRSFRAEKKLNRRSTTKLNRIGLCFTFLLLRFAFGSEIYRLERHGLKKKKEFLLWEKKPVKSSRFVGRLHWLIRQKDESNKAHKKNTAKRKLTNVYASLTFFCYIIWRRAKKMLNRLKIASSFVSVTLCSSSFFSPNLFLQICSSIEHYFATFFFQIGVTPFTCTSHSLSLKCIHNTHSISFFATLFLIIYIATNEMTNATDFLLLAVKRSCPFFCSLGKYHFMEWNFSWLITKWAIKMTNLIQ